LFTYEIKQKKSLTLPSTAADAGVKDRQVLFNKHFGRFWGDVGDLVAFKRPKKVKQLWRVADIETDLDKIKWSNDGWIPNYIKLEAEVTDNKGNTKLATCWTCENQLKPIGVKNAASRARR
jgi:hypothetical protein